MRNYTIQGLSDQAAHPRPLSWLADERFERRML
jgi:hypothetical protein